jgi:hypothetical protein
MVVGDRACQIYGMTIAIFSEDLKEETPESRVEMKTPFRIIEKKIMLLKSFHFTGKGKGLFFAYFYEVMFFQHFI